VQKAKYRSTGKSTQKRITQKFKRPKAFSGPKLVVWWGPKGVGAGKTIFDGWHQLFGMKGNIILSKVHL